LKDYIEQRTKQVAQHILNTHETIRQTAKQFGVSKSTIENDITIRLIEINSDIALRVADIVAENKAERHIRGGQSTKRKYMEVSNGTNRIEDAPMLTT